MASPSLAGVIVSKSSIGWQGRVVGLVITMTLRKPGQRSRAIIFKKLELECPSAMVATPVIFRRDGRGLAARPVATGAFQAGADDSAPSATVFCTRLAAQEMVETTTALGVATASSSGRKRRKKAAGVACPPQRGLEHVILALREGPTSRHAGVRSAWTISCLLEPAFSRAAAEESRSLVFAFSAPRGKRPMSPPCHTRSVMNFAPVSFPPPSSGGSIVSASNEYIDRG